MKRSRVLLFLAIIVTALALFICCDQETIGPQATGYSTPTIKGTVSIPSSSGFKAEDVWVKVRETGTIFKASADGSFLIQNLEEGTAYTLEFSTATPTNTSSRTIVATNFATSISGIKGQTGGGNDIGYVILRPTGNITGKVLLYGSDNSEGILVTAEGTSYSVQTEADGSFTLANLPEGTYTLNYTKDGYISRQSDRITILAPNDTQSPVMTVNDTYLFSSDSSARIEGTVSYFDKTDASGITIFLKDSTGTVISQLVTAFSGMFSFQNLPSGAYTLTASAPDYSEMITEVTLNERQVYNLSFNNLVSVYGLVEGTVKDTSGSPIQEVSVTISNQLISRSTLTTSDGKYSFDMVPSGTYSISFSKDEFISQSRSGIIVVSGKEISVGAVSLKSVYGILVVNARLDAGTDFSNINVSLYDGTTFVESKTTPASGSVSFSKVHYGTGYRIVLESEDYFSVEKTGISISGETTTEVVPNVMIYRYGSVQGSVVDNTGSPLAGAIVVLVSNSDSEVTYSITTDESGVFSNDRILEGRYTATVMAHNYGTVSLKTTAVIQSRQTTNLGTTKLIPIYGTVQGSVSYADRDNPKDISVIIVNEKGESVLSVITTETGSFAVSDIYPGTYTVTISASNYESKSSEVSVSAGIITSVLMEPLQTSLGAITGKVVLEGRSNYSGIIVSARSRSFPDKVFSSTTEADGTYYVGNLEAATYNLSFSLDGYYLDSPVSASVTAGSVETVSDVTMKSSAAKLSGTVSLAGAADHTGIQILFQNADSSRSYNTSTNQYGSFTLPQVLPDTYTIYISKSGYETKTITGITMTQSTDKALDAIELAVAVRSITGTVELEMVSDYSGALITATNIAEPTLIYSAITNSTGNYALAGMQPGEYQIVISKANYNTLTLPTVSIVDESTTNLGTTEVSIARGTISGIVRLEGYTDHSGITVSLNGTDYTTQTNASGYYELSVPSGNYSGGLLFERGDFQTDSHTEVISVLTNGTYGIATHTLTCLSIAEVKGTFELRHAEDSSGIQVTLSNAQHTYTITTEADGKWSFAHVPVGTYTLSTVREHTPDFSTTIILTACPVYDTSVLTLIPNSSNVSGFAKLEGLTSHGGITVTAVPDDVEEITRTTTTAADGSYTLSNLVSYVDYTITFSKVGWNSDSTTVVTGLQPLEERQLDTIVALHDTVAPVLNSLIINSGANVSSDNHVVLHFDATEHGSGIAKVMITYDNIFDRTVTRHDYLAPMDWTLPSGNGKKTVYVKVVDLSGNISNTISATITLTDQKTEVSGVLTGDKLHWTEANSPYLVTGNILVESDKTLTIDPGVDVQFAGEYYIQVEGLIEAIGTEQKQISFYGIDAGENTWKGINCVTNNLVLSGSDGTHSYTSGSIFSHVSIQNCSYGIRGYAYIQNCKINAYGCALGDNSTNYFYGMVKDSIVSGAVNYLDAKFYGNTLNNGAGSMFYGSLYGSLDTHYTYMNNNEVLGFSVSYIYGTGNRFTVNSASCVGNLSNSIFNGGTISTRGTMDNVTMIGCTVEIKSGPVMNCSFSDCSFSSYTASKMNFCNMTNCSTLPISTARTNSAEYDMRYNFWGYDKTRVMNEKGDGYNLSFITDYYDDFNTTKVVYSDWVQEPFSFVGYKGDDYSSYTLTPVVSESQTMAIASDESITVLGSNSLSITLNNGNEASMFRVFQDIDLVAGSETDSDLWVPVSSDLIGFTYNPTTDGDIFNWFVQLKDSEGNISSIYPTSVYQKAIGPAGGYVFYDKGYYSDGWRYLEAAPADLSVVGGVPTVASNSSGSFVFGYYRMEDNGDNLCVNGTTTYSSSNCTGTAVGTGMANTQLLVGAMGAETYSSKTGPSKTANYAARLCDILTYTFNGVSYDDWFLPSKDEQKMMYVNLHKAGLGGFGASGNVVKYWSSSEGAYNSAWYIEYYDGRQTNSTSRDSTQRVRPVRAF